MTFVPTIEMLKAKWALMATYDVEPTVAMAMLYRISDKNWEYGMYADGVELKPQAAEWVRRFAGPNGYAMIKAYEAQHGSDFLKK